TSLISIHNQTQESIWKLPTNGQSVNDPVTTFDTRLGTYSAGKAKVMWVDENSILSAEQSTDFNNHVAVELVKRDARTGSVLDSSFRLMANCWFYFNIDFTQAACPKSEENLVEIWSIDKQDVDFTLPITKVAQIQWSPDNQMLAFLKYSKQNNSDSDWFVEVIDSHTNQIKLTYKTECCNLPIWSPNSQFIAAPTISQSGLKLINIIETKTFKTTVTINGKEFAWSPNSQLVAFSTDNDITFYDPVKDKFIESDKIKNIASLAFSSDGAMLALGMDDGTIRIWDIADLMAN
ncbi:MAG: hypothetical protein ABI970_19680, partial [Chloroflexota bacterium]